MTTRTVTPIDLAPNHNSTIKARSYLNQYSNIYFNRLNLIKPNLINKAHARWASQAPIFAHRTLDISTNTLSFFIGTIYCQMPIKPSILDDIALEYANQLPKPLPPKYFSQADDHLSVAIEDEHGRVDLILSDTPSLVTGVVVAVLGSVVADGAFNVVDFCFPGLASIPRAPKSTQDACWVALVSGLNVGSGDALGRLLLAHLLVGNLDLNATNHLISNISHLFVLGNSCDEMDATEHLDSMFQLITASHLPITILPGPTDPATHLLPQQPIHKSMFPKTSLNSNFTSVTNPVFANISQHSIVLTSGQNLDDVYKYSCQADRLDMACQFLNWRHVAPTAPDTLWCYPYRDTDPFVLNCYPRLFAIGNQPEFQTCLFKDPDGPNDLEPVRVMLVPEFSKTGKLVLVNLESLEYHVIELNVDDSTLPAQQ